jgi:hypothetical protein
MSEAVACIGLPKLALLLQIYINRLFSRGDGELQA